MIIYKAVNKLNGKIYIGQTQHTLDERKSQHIKKAHSGVRTHFYDAIREQIKNPESFIIPERLWTFQNIAVPDGLYYTMDNLYRGFFVVYTLKLIRSYKVCCLIPTPKVEYLAACMQFRELGPNNPISVCSLPNLDFLSDKEAMIQLRAWCYGWDMKI